MHPRLLDPFAGVANAARYIYHWGDSLYRDHCARVGTTALAYADFEARTLAEGKDWWAVEGEAAPQEPDVPLQTSK